MLFGCFVINFINREFQSGISDILDLLLTQIEEREEHWENLLDDLIANHRHLLENHDDCSFDVVNESILLV